jgi:hypothetical protein
MADQREPADWVPRFVPQRSRDIMGQFDVDGSHLSVEFTFQDRYAVHSALARVSKVLR